MIDRNGGHNVSQLGLDLKLKEQTDKENLGSTILAERGRGVQVDQSVNLMEAVAEKHAITGSNSVGATAGGARSGRLRQNWSKQTRPSMMEAMFGRQSMVDAALGVSFSMWSFGCGPARCGHIQNLSLWSNSGRRTKNESPLNQSGLIWHHCKISGSTEQSILHRLLFLLFC